MKLLIKIITFLSIIFSTVGAFAAGKLNLYNWSDYTPPELVEKFEAETGIEVTIDSYDSNETLLAKLQAGGGSTGYDLAVPSQHFVEIMIKEGLIEKVDGIKDMPNYKYVAKQFQGPSFDPMQEYSTPYQMGSASWAYRANSYSGDGSSMMEFFKPSDEVCGKVAVFKSPEEVVNMAHLALGSNFCSEDPNEMQAVLDLLLEQKQCVAVYSSEGINDRLMSGEVVIHAHWDGYSQKGKWDGVDDLTYAYPKEGVVGWFDSLVVPKGAKNIEEAKAFMNFLMHPENMAILSNFAAYANAIPESQKYLSDKMQNATNIQVPDGIPVKFGQACNANSQALIDKVWTRLMQ
jgi:spermidine/putrescine transport system substrate-binding protein